MVYKLYAEKISIFTKNNKGHVLKLITIHRSPSYTFHKYLHGQHSKVLCRNEEFGREDFDCRLITSDIHKKESRL